MVLPLGHQKWEFSSRLELDAHGSLMIEFSIRKMTLQVLFSWFLYALGMRGIRNRRAADCDQISGYLWDMNWGVFRIIEVAWGSQRLISSLFNRRGMRECRLSKTAMWPLLISCMCTAKITTSENIASLFVFPIRHTLVCTSGFY